jgi:hypothetical protein
MTLGLNGPLGKHYCIWCLGEKRERGNFTIPFANYSLSNWRTAKRLREMRANLPNGADVPKDVKATGQVRWPLLDFFPFLLVCPDELHTTLRVSDVLLQLLIAEAAVIPEGADRIVRYVCSTDRQQTKRV